MKTQTSVRSLFCLQYRLFCKISNKVLFFLTLLLCCCNLAVAAGSGTDSAGVQCRNQDGAPVDWWVIVKLPREICPIPETSQTTAPHMAGLQATTAPGYCYLYLDASKQPIQFFPDGDRGLDKPNQALYYTINQIYDAYKNYTPDVGWLMYNDSTPYSTYYKPFCVNIDKDPDFHPDNSQDSYSHYCGHAKGTFAFDKNTGFWLVHSITDFPRAATKSGNYEYSSSSKYGQTALCISMPVEHMRTNQFNLISKQLKYVNPAIYNYYKTDAAYTNMPDFMDLISKPQTGVITDPDTTNGFVYSLAGKKFTITAETNPYPNDNAIPFYQYAANLIFKNISVQSWLNESTPPIGAICDATYKVNQIGALSTANVGNGVPIFSWSTLIDHSKWAVGINSNNDTKTIADNITACIGDINNTFGQKKRGGGTVCFDDKEVHGLFFGMITSSTDCPVIPNPPTPPTPDTDGSSHHSSNDTAALVIGGAALVGGAAILLDRYFGE